MITQLRERNRADRFLNDVRANQKKHRNYGRYVYLFAVLCLFLWLLNLFVGPYVWLKAEGLVVADHVVVASPYEVQVLAVVAKPGQQVRKGEVLVRINSPQVAEAMATLTSRSAETTARQAELAIKLEVANTLMKSAEERLSDTEAQLKRINTARGGQGFVSDSFLASVQKDRYAAMQEKASREAERRAAEKQLAQLEKSQTEARTALEKLRQSYNDGVVTAPADGIVGPKIAVQGDVIKPGDHLMQLYTGEKFALVYLETGTLYRVSTGDKVMVADGFTNTNGEITQVLPLTVPLPTEFQKAFRPPSRGQVARITLEQPDIFPMSSKVSVVGDKLLPGNDTLTRSGLYRSLGEKTAAAFDILRQVALDLNGQVTEGATTLANVLDQRIGRPENEVTRTGALPSHPDGRGPR